MKTIPTVFLSFLNKNIFIKKITAKENIKLVNTWFLYSKDPAIAVHSMNGIELSNAKLASFVIASKLKVEFLIYQSKPS